MTRPQVCISFVKDHPVYTEWVSKLVDILHKNGVQVMMGEWTQKPGDYDPPLFTSSIDESDFVLVIGSPRYGLDASAPNTDVGRESERMREAVQKGVSRRKFVPLLREDDATTSFPPWLQEQFFLDFRDGSLSGPEMDKLLKIILGDASRQVKTENAASRLDVKPVVVNCLRIENLRAIRSLEVPIPSNRRTGGKWTIFLGDNGTGKTTVLQAVGLASISDEQRTGIAVSTLAPFIRHGADEAIIELECEGRRQHVNLKKDGGGGELFDGKVEGDRPPYLVFGYGCGRGSALGGPDRAVLLGRSIDRVGTLYGLSSSLIHGETWLRNLEYAALKDESEGDREFSEAVKKTVLGLLPGVETMEIRSDRIWLQGPDIGKCLFAGLSDGYITTLGWSLDLIARWSHEAKKFDLCGWYESFARAKNRHDVCFYFC